MPILRYAGRPSARGVDAAYPGAGDSDIGCRRRRNTTVPSYRAWFPRPARACYPTAEGARRAAGLASRLGSTAVGVTLAVPQDLIWLWVSTAG
jgi:hypothetical protein